ncbi:MAG: hypothetical protein JSU07_00130 [Bacteroidetes bacterium]|nr:hypothetical protein [Bacteroidota bacterium]
MQKLIKSLFIASSLSLIIFFSCNKKNSDNSIAPTYRQNATGTGANPNVNVQTTTGTNTVVNPATNNSSINTGGSGWSNPTCASSSSLVIQGNNGSTQVTITFATPPSAGNYAVGQYASAGVCAVQAVNAPGQPANIVWYSKTNSGSVSVQTSTSGITAYVNNVQLVQQNFNFPAVTVSGTVSCN